MIKLDLGTMVTISSWIVAIDSYIVDRINKKDMQWKDFMVLFVAISMIL